MNREKFKKKVEQKLKKLNKEQVVYFAWRCGVRALPLLGSSGSFNFWNKKDRQKHIYSVFYALDSIAAGSAYDSGSAAEDAAATASTATVTTTSKSADYDVILAVAYAAVSVFIFDNAAVSADAAADAATTAAYASEKKNVNFESIILRDLDAIRGMEGGAT